MISKHKSYHVWNQDNVEKVMRDERLHKEKLEAAAQREKDSLQEKNREALLTSRDPSVAPAGAEREIFNLFGNLESAAAEETARKLKRREQEAKDALLLRQNGATPWALGDGSREKSGQRAWYEATQPLSSDPSSSAGITVMGKRVTGSEEQGARSRDTARKNRLDPMAPLMHGGAGVWAEAKTDDGRKECRGGHAYNKDRRQDREDRGEGDDRGREDRRHKKRKKDRKHSCKDHAAESPEDEDARLLRELRRKRLDRERSERKKTAVLLARRDIYGSS